MLTHSPSAATLIRPSTPTDVAAIAKIYSGHVSDGTGTFELEAPNLAEMANRRQAVLDAGWPWLVVTRADEVLGFAYANAFRPRRAYRFCVEDSIYLAPHATGLGLGRWLLAELMGQCEARGARQMIAVIGDSANAASVAVHRSLGFEPIGVMKAAGWKLDDWRDVVLMQRALGLGSSTSPPEGR
jgi:phosphinothricin acetyltransferase